MFKLSVCTGTVLQDLPFLERVRAIAQAGFVVDLWDWDDDAVDEIAADPDITINAMPGWRQGSMSHPDEVGIFLEGVQANLEVAARIGCRTLAIAAGELNEAGHFVQPLPDHQGTMWITAYKCLCRLMELAEEYDVQYNFEVFNTKTDHAGYPFRSVDDGLCLVEQVDHPRFKLLLDLYHAQIEEGNVTERIRHAISSVGAVHVADVPGRHQPGTGEMNYPYIAQVLRDVGYAGPVTMEAFPKGDDYEAMESFRAMFS